MTTPNAPTAGAERITRLQHDHRANALLEDATVRSRWRDYYSQSGPNHNADVVTAIDVIEGLLAALEERSQELAALRDVLMHTQDERLILAKLCADEPQFDNPLHVYAAKRIRDLVLAHRTPMVDEVAGSPATDDPAWQQLKEDYHRQYERANAAESQLLAASREVERLTRARAAAIASLAKRDALGAMAALTMSRDHPDLFDRSTFEDAPAALAATPEKKPAATQETR